MTTTARPYILFDAGGTIVYPDVELIALVSGEFGGNLSPDDFLNSFFRTMYLYDHELRNNGSAEWSGRFLTSVVENAGVHWQTAAEIIEESKRRNGSKSLWAYTRPWARAALSRLHEAGYRMSVISNSDGTVEELIRTLDLIQYFERVFDSAIVGVEKPDPRIFELALSSLKLQPNSCIYVGDLVMVDVLGANRAGIGAVHIDGLGLYSEWPGLHFRNVEAFADAILAGEISLDDNRLFPLNDDSSA